ncbi:MAG: hypothetical protein HQL16_03175 [Candidatus Omnitrophica bacterium]|nr:hypothetical protein [Candidatus Omnitrophota bacterium]
MKAISIAIFVFAFLLLRISFMQDNGMWYNSENSECFGNDDQEYFVHASSLAFGQFPSYKKEICYGLRSPTCAIGAGIMASPFVFAFSWFDRLTGSDIVESRTYKNVSGSWSQFGFVFAASVYFWFACFLLYRALRWFIEKRYATMAVIYMIVCQGLPLYVYRRPIFSHVFEFFLQSLMIFMLLRNLKRDSFELKGVLPAVGTGVLVALIYLVRYNNFFAALIWPFALFCRNFSEFKTARFWRTMAVVCGAAGAVVFLFKILPDHYLHYQGYSSVGNILLQLRPLTFYLKRAWHILFGVDWGLLYTAPFIFLGIAGLFLKDFTGRVRIFISLIPMCVTFYIMIVWGSQGCFYGYRLIMASIMPLLVFPLAYIFKKSDEKYGQKIRLFWMLIALFPVLSMLFFESGDNLALQHDLNMGWTNHTFQLEVWKTAFGHPKELFFVLFKRVIYFIYLLATLLGFKNKMPATIVNNYPIYDFWPTLKVFILYALPFVLYGLTRRKKRSSSDQGK